MDMDEIDLIIKIKHPNIDNPFKFVDSLSTDQILYLEEKMNTSKFWFSAHIKTSNSGIGDFGDRILAALREYYINNEYGN
jgi:hypothetical protein